MSYDVEKDWITSSGLRAVVIMLTGRGEYNHRCGYVAVTADHPAYQKGYSEQLDCIKQEQVNECKLGKKSPILILTAACISDDENKKVRRSIDILIDVHGGVTYSGGNDEYPVPFNEGWWFGFDTGHYGDIPAIGGQSLEYCIDECESMASQLKGMVQA